MYPSALPSAPPRGFASLGGLAPIRRAYPSGIFPSRYGNSAVVRVRVVRGRTARARRMATLCRTRPSEVAHVPRGQYYFTRLAVARD